VSAARAAAVACAALALAGCDRTPGVPDWRPLDAAAQAAVAGKLARAYAGPCLSEASARAAADKLQAQGWPAFNAVWNQPGSLFLAAKPSAAAPVGLFVISNNSPGLRELNCVGHYSALDAAAMTAAVERVWGPGEPSLSPAAPGAQAWVFLLKSGRRTPLPASAGPGGAGAVAALAALRPGEAFVYVQVSYNPAQRGVASLVSVRRAP
jgi:hypothetical protein